VGLSRRGREAIATKEYKKRKFIRWTENSGKKGGDYKQNSSEHRGARE